MNRADAERQNARFDPQSCTVTWRARHTAAETAERRFALAQSIEEAPAGQKAEWYAQGESNPSLHRERVAS